MPQIIDSHMNENWFYQELKSLGMPEDIVLINASHKPYESSFLQDFHGIGEAAKIVKEGKRVIIYGFMASPFMYLREDFRSLFADYCNSVRYVRLPPDENFTEFLSAFGLPQFENPALRFVNKSEQDTPKRGHFLHDIDRHRGQVLAEARKYFSLQGSDEEIEAQLRSYKPSQIPAEGIHLPGVFCDMEGTLMKNDDVNKELLDELGIYAKEKPVSLWTGSDVKVFENLDVPYPVLSKHDFRGAEVEFAIDNLAKADFEKEYGIRAREYRQVSQSPSA